MKTPNRLSPEGKMPLISCEGSSYECGQQLGIAWQHVLRQSAQQASGRWTPWWLPGRGGTAAKLIEKRAPHLIEIFRGMANSAGIDEELCGYGYISAPLGGCTSFSVHRDSTVDGHAIAGQTKDTGKSRTFLYQVLRLKPSDAPGLLTVTYPGELIGYGFAQKGMSIFRNALYVTPEQNGGELPFDAFGMLAHFASSLEEVAEMATKHGVSAVGHCTIADENGRALGFELCQGQVEIIDGRNGLYAHANHTVSGKFKPFETETDRQSKESGSSEHRQTRLYELMEKDRGRLTPQIMMRNLSDHANYPRSICCHRDQEYHTSAAILAEPTRGQLHVARGSPCQNWPTTYQL